MVPLADRAMRLMKEGSMSAREAVTDAVSVRFRPIMMSTLTTICGLSPLVFMPGAGTELYRGVGAIVLFGLLFASLITIVFLPPLLTMVLDLVHRPRARVEPPEEPLEPIETDKIRRIG